MHYWMKNNVTGKYMHTHTVSGHVERKIVNEETKRHAEKMGLFEHLVFEPVDENAIENQEQRCDCSDCKNRERA